MSSTPRNKTKKKRQSLTPKQGQLTGIPRKLKDGVADIYNSIQKWENLKNKGFNVVTDIANLKIEKRGEEEQSCYPDGLDSLCHQFLNIGDEMQRLSSKMETIAEQFEKITNMSSISQMEVFFTSWLPSKFAESAKEISKMYSEEMKAKSAIVQNVAHVDLHCDGGLLPPESARDVLMTYVACWLHEPYIREEARTILLEELLLETGHH